jgi:tRNA A37 methylthiotransferase MiaB
MDEQEIEKKRGRRELTKANSKYENNVKNEIKRYRAETLQSIQMDVSCTFLNQ